MERYASGRVKPDPEWEVRHIKHHPLCGDSTKTIAVPLSLMQCEATISGDKLWLATEYRGQYIGSKRWVYVENWR